MEIEILKQKLKKKNEALERANRKIKNLERRNKYLDEWGETYRDRYLNLRETLEFFPKSFWKVTFKGFNEQKTLMVEKSEIHECIHPKALLKIITNRLYHPDSFELVDLKKIG